MSRPILTFLASIALCMAHAQWVPGGMFSSTVHFQACAFHHPDSGLFVYGANNPGPTSSATEGGVIRTDNGATGGGYYIWYEPSTNFEDIDVKVAGGRPFYLAAGHELYGRSIILRPYGFPDYVYSFDSVRTGDSRYYRAVRMRSDLVAFAAGGDYLGNGIIDMSVDSGRTWTNIASLTGQPVSRLHFVNDQLGFAATGGYRRLINNGIYLPDSGAIYRTTNGGLDWEQVHADPAVGFSDVDFLDASTGVATRNDGAILRTTDGGESWSPALVNWAGPYVMTSAVFRDDGTGFASCYRTDGTAGFILSSIDDGATWGFNFSTASFNHSRRIYDLYFHDDEHGYASTQIRPLRTNGLVMEVAEQEAARIGIYPNPATEEVTIVLPINGAQVELIDATGRIVRSARAASSICQVDVRELPAGAYVVRLHDRGAVSSAWLLKQ